MRDDIQKAFRDARPAIAAEGREAGRAWGENFGSGAQDKVGDAVRDAVNSPEISRVAAEGGQNAGSVFGSAMGDELGNVDMASPLKEAADEAMSEVEKSVEEGSRNAGDTAEREMGNSGRRGGKSFGDGFLKSDFAKSAMAASSQFTQLMGTSNLMGPAIASLVSGLASAAGGLFAMASAAGAAAPALGVLPGLALAAAQGMGALKLAFSGVGAAISAGFKAAVPQINTTASAVNAAQRAVNSAQTALARAQQDAATRMADAQQNLADAEIDAAKRMADARQNLADTERDASRRMADARQNLARVYQDAADAMVTANRKVSDAEQGVKDAQKDLIDVQRQLTAARQDAIEQLQQLAFSAEDAALGEERAGLRLEDAHAKLVAAQQLPVDDRGRREAELGYKEAELAFREAKDRNADMKKEESNAAKAGVNGQKSVVDARNKVADAQNKIVDAEQNLADARRDRSKTELDNAQKIADAKTNIARTQADNEEKIAKAQDDIRQTRFDNERKISAAREGIAKAQLQNQRSISDAQKGLADAQARLNDAQSKGTSAANAYKTALAGLSPPARDFVKYLVSLKDEFKALKTAAGTELFPKLKQSIEPVVKNVFPLLERQLRTTGGLMGDAALGLTNMFRTGEKNRLGQVLKGNNQILEVFTKRGKNGENAFSRVVRVMLRLAVAVQPVTKRFATWINSLTIGAERATRSADSMNKLTGFFNRAGDVAAQLGRIIGNLLSSLWTLAGASQQSGQGLLDSFEKATDKLDRFLKKLRRKGDLQDWFKAASENVKDFGDLATVIGGEFFKLGDNRGPGKLATGLIPAAKNLGSIGDKLTTASPALGRFATDLTKLLDKLTQSSQVETFINTLDLVVRVILKVIHWIGVAANWFDRLFEKFTKWLGFGNGISNITGKVAKFALAAAAIHRALSFALIPISFFFKALIGGPIKVVKSFLGIFKIFGRIPRALASIKGGGIRNAFRMMSGASDKAKTAFEEQMVTDKLKTEVLEKLEKQAKETARALDKVKTAGSPAAGAASAAAAGAAGEVDDATGAATGSDKGGKHKEDKKPGLLRRRLGQRNEGGFVSLGSGADQAEKATKKSTGKIAGHLTKMKAPFALAGKAAGGFGLALKGLGGGLMALTGGPLGLLMIALPLIIKGFSYLYKHSPAFRKFVDGIVQKLKEFGKWAMKIINNYVIPALNSFFKSVNKVLPPIGRFFGRVFTKIIDVIKTVFTFVKKHWVLILSIITGPVGAAVIFVIRHWKQIKDKTNDMVVFIKKKWNDFKDKVKAVKDKIGEWVGNIKSFFQKMWEKTRDVIKLIRSKWDDFRDKIRDVKTKINGWIQDIKDKAGTLLDKIRNVINPILNKFDDFKDKVKDVRNKISTWIGDIKDAIGSIGTKVSGVFGKLGDFAKNGINDFITFLNNRLIDNINKVTGKFGLTIAHIPNFAEGGYTGPGPKYKPAGVVHADEFVVRKAARQRIERQAPGLLREMNRTGQLPMGDWGPLGAIAGSIGDAASGAWDSIENLAKAGIGKVLERLVDGAKLLMSGSGIKRDSFLNKIFYGIMDKLADAARGWGRSKQQDADDKAAPKGAAGNVNVAAPSVPGGHVIYRGGEFSKLFVAHLKAAERLANTGLVVFQGGFRPATSYSGTSHRGDAIDIHVNYALLRALRRVGIAAGDRTGLGNWAPHIHAVPGPKAGYGAGSAVWQWTDYLARGGMRQSPRSSWGLAAGGIVPATRSGIQAVIGEGGRPERVEPLDRSGLSARDRALVEMIRKVMKEANHGDSYHVYPSRGMDERELAEMVIRKRNFQRRAGT